MQQYPYLQQPPPPKKKSSALLWLIGGGCLLLSLGGVGVIALLGGLAWLGSSATTVASAPAPAAPEATPAGAALPAGPASGSRFVNAKGGLTGDMLTHYVPFSIDYAAGWKLGDKAREQGKFVELSVKQNLTAGINRDVAKVAVSWWEVDKGGAKRFIEGLKFEGGVKPQIKAVTLGGRSGWEARTTGQSKLLGKPTTMFFVRAALPAEPNGNSGLYLITFVERGTGMGDTLDEVGTKGDLQKVFDSMLIGNQVSAASLAAPCAFTDSDNCMDCCSMYGHSRATYSGNRCNCS